MAASRCVWCMVYTPSGVGNLLLMCTGLTNLSQVGDAASGLHGLLRSGMRTPALGAFTRRSSPRSTLSEEEIEV